MIRLTSIQQFVLANLKALIIRKFNTHQLKSNLRKNINGTKTVSQGYYVENLALIFLAVSIDCE